MARIVDALTRPRYTPVYGPPAAEQAPADNNPELLFRGSPDQVAKARELVLNSGVPILAPECAVPLTTPLENLRTLVKAAERAARCH